MSAPADIIDLSDLAMVQAAHAHIRACAARGGLHRFECAKVRKTRSLAQNAYYWGVVLADVARGIEAAWGEPITPDEAHEFLKDRFLAREVIDHRSGKRMGRTVPSTTELNTAEFARYIDSIIIFATDYLGVRVRTPDEHHIEQREKVCQSL